MVQRTRNAVLDRLPTEHEEQREFVSWFRKTYQGTRIFAIPNGGARNIATASKLKVEGVSRGVPDLCVPAWNVWVEMKRQKGGRVDDAQLDWHCYLTEVGHSVLVCQGFEDAKEQITAWVRKQGESDGTA
ncbi:MAG: VRR-NUC domain-containing protein [Steroidobacteraceae bacterium]